MLRTGRIRKALTELHRAVDLDPLSCVANAWLGWCYAQTDSHEVAIEQLQKAIDMAPDAYAYGLPGELGRMYVREGFLDKARDTFKKASLEDSIWFLVKCGERQKAQRMVDTLWNKYGRSSNWFGFFAEAFACLGDNGKAFAALHRVYETNPIALLNITIEPNYDGLRSDPRFAALLRKMGMHD